MGVRYEFGPVIGRGVYGEVREGRDRHLDRAVAVKVLGRAESGDPEQVRRLVAEAKLTGRLQHPGVVPVYDLGTDEDGRPFFVMRLIRGETLETRLAQRRSPTGDLRRYLRIFVKLCQTVAYAREQGAVHGNLDPAKVVIGDYGEVQVVEWGRGDGDGTHDDRALRAILTAILADDAEPALSADCEAATAPELAVRVEAHLAAAEDRAHRAQVRTAQAHAAAEDQRRARRHAVVVALAVLALLLGGGATLFFIEHARVARDRRIATAVDGALEVAITRRADGSLPTAEAMAARALELAEDADPGRRRQAEALLEGIRAEQRAAERAAERRRRESALLARLDRLRIHGRDRTDAPPSIEWLAAGPADRAEEISCGLLACHLSDPAADLAGRADALDPDEERTAIRAAIVEGDLPTLVQFTKSEPASPDLGALVGRVLHDAGRPEGLAFLRRVQRRFPGHVRANWELATALAGRPDPRWFEILRFASAAAALGPDEPAFRYLAGRAMLNARDRPSADLTSRELVRRFPDFAPGRTLRAAFLQDRGDYRGSIGHLREAIRSDGEFEVAHRLLAIALARTGVFAEALTAARRAAALSSAGPRWYWATDSTDLVAICERYLALEALLPDILAGRLRPEGDEETLEFALVLRATEHYATSAAYYRIHFKATGRRKFPGQVDAIATAILAGCGRGKDARRLDEEDRAKWRERALDWMIRRRDALGRRGGLYGSRNLRGGTVAALRRWREDPDYADVRDPDRLKLLPEEERAAWREFWESIDAQIERMGAR